MNNGVNDDPPATSVLSVAPDGQGNAAAAAARIQSLDVLRGVGVLGMLAVHIQLFALPGLASRLHFQPNVSQTA